MKLKIEVYLLSRLAISPEGCIQKIICYNPLHWDLEFRCFSEMKR